MFYKNFLKPFLFWKKHKVDYFEDRIPKTLKSYNYVFLNMYHIVYRVEHFSFELELISEIF